ncbi:hypothetical protein BdWA1_001753 [Babesia duncani]|uniref:Uncharacterized protein n=1 Tax=Babesia duncani TaxID=323732 RepID=A0AAD9PL07_9APIC|nr:hypothetical protein BdWA1_001753 [Babesia duncani]
MALAKLLKLTPKSAPKSHINAPAALLKERIGKRRLLDSFFNFEDEHRRLARSSKIAFVALGAFYAVPSILAMTCPPPSVFETVALHQSKLSAMGLAWSCGGGLVAMELAGFNSGTLLAKLRVPVAILNTTLGACAALIYADFFNFGPSVLWLIAGHLIQFGFVWVLWQGKALPSSVAKYLFGFSAFNIMGLTCTALMSKRVKRLSKLSPEEIVAAYEARFS